MTTQPDSRCDSDISENGHTVAVMAGTSTAIEAIVVRVREELGVPIDWHFLGGRANILTTAPADWDDAIRYALHRSIPSWLGPSPAVVHRGRFTETARATNKPEADRGT